MSNRVVAGLVLVTLLVGLGAGCDGKAGGAVEAARTVEPGRSAGTLCVPHGGASAAAPDQPSEPLPDLTLPCFGPGDDVRIARLGVPAVINLWASWCGPCRAELPAFQRYAERVGDRLQVVGVNTEDTRTAAQSLVDDLRLRFPMLYDRQGALRKAVGKAGLPITLFVNARGQITFLYNAQALDDATLELLAEQHLGVAVPR